MASNPATIVDINPDASKLWLGGLVQGSGYAQGPGSLRELPIRQRTPLTVYIDLLGKHDSISVARPTAASVQQAIGRLVQTAIHDKVPIPTRVSYQKATQSSSNQALLDLNISAKYVGASAAASLSSHDNAQQSTVMAEFYQRLLTVSIVKPQVPSGYFSPGFTPAALREQQRLGRIGRTNPPVVVSSISYGRVLLYSVTSTASANDLQATLDAAWNGGAASASIHLSDQQKRILQSATYKVIALGGPESEIQPLLQQHALGDYFKAHMNLATAVPISYQVDNLGQDSTAKFSETTNYNLTECTPISNHQVVIGANVQMSDPNAYLAGGPGSADTYGYVNLNNQASWNVSRNLPFTISNSALTPMQWLPAPDPSVSSTARDYALYFDPALGPSTLHLEGSINCKLAWWQIGSDPSNQYNWTWNLNGTSYGAVTLDGGSAHCPIQLRTSVTKLSDITKWLP